MRRDSRRQDRFERLTLKGGKRRERSSQKLHSYMSCSSYIAELTTVDREVNGFNRVREENAGSEKILNGVVNCSCT
jgi:hypothetical protein